uniref:Uncharacterized protein n=1 Tax=Rhizophora mucronata TaxID=61149 RepID=A0A2P2QHM3_RHIMU
MIMWLLLYLNAMLI